MHEGGGSCLKYLKRRWNRKEGRGNKDFKKGEGQAGSRVGCLKKGGGGWNPLTNYAQPNTTTGELANTSNLQNNTMTQTQEPTNSMKRQKNTV